MSSTSSTVWSPDAVLSGYEATTLRFPDDYDGPVVATLVRKRASSVPRRAVLYIHGFSDYFFQAHLAEQYLAHGFDFYALDLRKYGRSLREGQHPNFCRDVSEHYVELSAAIDIITSEERHPFLLINGHSTGGLIAAAYAHDGAHRDRIGAMFLNSPLLAFKLNPLIRSLLGVVASAGLIAPYRTIEDAILPFYGQSLHKAHHGEWEFDTRWKPIDCFPVYLGWMRAIDTAHRHVRAGLDIKCPVLVMHASRSFTGKQWDARCLVSDTMVNVDDIKQLARRLGKRVTVVEIENGLHDLTLSRADVRARVFTELFSWIDGLGI